MNGVCADAGPGHERRRVSIGRDEQVVAASSGMRGEKYRDEVGLGRSDGDDLRNELRGPPIQQGQLEER